MSKKKNIYKALLIILFGFVSSADAIAEHNKYHIIDKFWVAANDGTDKVWHDSANWSTQSGGSGGAGTPNSKADNAVFDSNSTVNVKLEKNVKKIYKLKVLNGYSGTINLNGKNLVTQNNMLINSGTVLVPANSTFQSLKDLYIGTNGTVTASGNASKIKVKSNLKIYGVLTAPSGGDDRFLVRGGFNLYSGGIFYHNDGTVTLNTRYKNKNGRPTAALKIADGPGTGRNFYNLKKTAKRGIYLNGDIKIENDLSVIGKGPISAKNLSNTNYDITIGGDLYLKYSSSLDPQSGNVIFNGSSAQTIDSTASFNNVQISNSNVSLDRAATVTGTLTIDSGATLDINGKNLTVGTLANNGNLQLKGSETHTITTKDNDSGTIT